jgi:hypothetical protein
MWLAGAAAAIMRQSDESPASGTTSNLGPLQG